MGKYKDSLIIQKRAQGRFAQRHRRTEENYKPWILQVAALRARKGSNHKASSFPRARGRTLRGLKQANRLTKSKPPEPVSL